jgi:gamma-glutamyl-gamma-aminobutyraldehyde dehydrogenase/4-guanidinobutyraldehyde dehydrogenase/NAD-dependent aldehyde dehydrogenase
MNMQGSQVIPGLRREAFIGRRFVTPPNSSTLPLVNPTNGETFAHIVDCSPVAVDFAVQSARQAFEYGRWRRQPPKVRKLILQRLADLIDKHAEELAYLERISVGKPIRDSRTLDIPKSAGMIRWYAEAIDKLYDEVAPTGPGTLATITNEPLGVVAASIPWNYPLYLAAYKLGPALATGNSVVLKPAEQSPLTVLRVAELAIEAGLPEGVLNVVPGRGDVTGKALGLHPDVDCLTFTGSTAVAKLYLGYAGQSNMKKVQLEAGGKSPNIVMSDAKDLARVAKEAAWGIFFNQGQVCSAGSRLIAHHAIKDELVAEIVRVARSMRIGDPLRDDTDLGPMVSAAQLDKVLRYIQAGKAGGARLALGGSRILSETGGSSWSPLSSTASTIAIRSRARKYSARCFPSSNSIPLNRPSGSRTIQTTVWAPRPGAATSMSPCQSPDRCAPGRFGSTITMRAT